MAKEELVQFLKENLKVEVSASTDYDYDSSYTTVTVRLYFGDEEISSDTTSF